MKNIAAYILAKLKSRFRTAGIDFDAQEMSFQLFKGLKIGTVVVCTRHYQARINQLRLRFNILRILAGKGMITAIQCDHVNISPGLPGGKTKEDVPSGRADQTPSTQATIQSLLRTLGRLRQKLPDRLDIASGEIILYHQELIPIPLHLSVRDLNVVLHRPANGLIIDHTMQASFPRLGLTIKSRFQTGSKPVLTCSLRTSDFQPEDILASFPIFTSGNASAFRSSGTLRFAGDLNVELADPWKYAFQAKLDQNNFSFSGDGALDLRYLNDPFLHIVRGQHHPRTEIFLGRDNPHFAALDTIPENLIKVIVSTEDPRFYTHNGFDGKLFGYALLTNVREKKATRGGSTITMQLARNLFLHHGKTAYRKLEEMILTWMIEDIYRIPKPRIMELYLNIIEFGPGIYGIKQACAFYFAATPESLTLTQSIVLAYIIPRPLHFAEALEEKSLLLPARLGEHVLRVGRRLKRKGRISQEELNGIGTRIQFAGSLGEIQFPGVSAAHTPTI
jgi:Transglycosylase